MRTPAAPSTAVLAIIVALGLTACAPDYAGAGSAPASDSVSADQSDAAEGQAAAPVADDELVTGLGLVTCPEAEPREERVSDVDRQWKYTYACTSRDAYDASVAALGGSFEHPLSESLGTDTSLADWDQFRGTYQGSDTVVDLKLKGPLDDLEMVVLITIQN